MFRVAQWLARISYKYVGLRRTGVRVPNGFEVSKVEVRGIASGGRIYYPAAVAGRSATYSAREQSM